MHPPLRQCLTTSAIRRSGAKRMTVQAQRVNEATPVTTGEEIWRGEYWADKGDVKLAMYRKRLGAPAPGETPRPVLFLVHGSSNSAQSSFDLNVPGQGEYSIMN